MLKAKTRVFGFNIKILSDFYTVEEKVQRLFGQDKNLITSDEC